MEYKVICSHHATARLRLRLGCLLLSHHLRRLLLLAELGLELSGISLLHKQLLSGGLGLLVVNSLHQHTLVLVLVTLGLHIQLVVEMPVDFLGLSVFTEQSAQHSHASHPQDLEGHTRIHGTLSSTVAGVSALALRVHVALVASLGVNRGLSLEDKIALDQLADGLSAVGTADLSLLIGVKPDLLRAASEHGGCEP